MDAAIGVGAEEDRGVAHPLRVGDGLAAAAPAAVSGKRPALRASFPSRSRSHQTRLLSSSSTSSTEKPISVAKRRAPSPVSMTCGSRFITSWARRATGMVLGTAPTRADFARRAVHHRGVAFHLAQHVGPAAIADAAHLGLGLDLRRCRQPWRSGCRRPSVQHLDGGRDSRARPSALAMSSMCQSFRILERNCATRGCARPPSAAKNSSGRQVDQQHALLEEDDAVGDLPGEFDFVGDEHHGGAAGRQLGEDVEHLRRSSRGRARWSPRRAAGSAASSPAPGRCRRAGAGRPRAAPDRHRHDRRARPSASSARPSASASALGRFSTSIGASVMFCSAVMCG